jgi:hypothetical protein
MTKAWSTKASASAWRPPPSARAIAEEMPPPMAPPDIICISITTGNTTAIPASASVPRWDSHQVSTKPVLACASITKMFGQESRKRVEAMGPRRKSSRREPPTAPALCNWSAVLAAMPLVRSDSPTLFEDHQRPGKGRMFKCYPSTTGSAGRVSRSEL